MKEKISSDQIFWEVGKWGKYHTEIISIEVMEIPEGWLVFRDRTLVDNSNCDSPILISSTQSVIADPDHKWNPLVSIQTD